jgi:UTP--glucose-1-phosphate uridylyltransferase
LHDLSISAFSFQHFSFSAFQHFSFSAFSLMLAIIPAAGFGTRFLPASKVIPKEMLPIGDKPAIQWIVEEALDAGADQVIIVTSPDKPAIRAHFTPDPAWQARLRTRPEALAALNHLDRISAAVRFVDQTEQRGLGHAVAQAASLVRRNSDPVLILLGDALVQGPAPCSRDLVARSRAHGGASVIGLERVPREKVSRYGIAAVEPTSDASLYRLTDLIEKPDPAVAPSDLAVAGRYLLDTRIFDFLAHEQIGHGGEIQLTDAIRQLIPLAPVYGYRYPGKRFDIGNPRGYQAAVTAYGESFFPCSSPPTPTPVPA